MAYTKPGVEITQVQTTAQPILTAPDMIGCIIGEGFWWQDPSWDDSTDTVRYSVFATQYENNYLFVPYSGINSTYNTNVLEGSVIVDLLPTQGDGAGILVNVLTSQFTTTASGIYIDASLISSGAKADIHVGFLAKNPDNVEQFGTLSSLSDIRDAIGEPVSWNPLAYGIYTAMVNAGTEISYIGVSGFTADNFGEALDNLASEEVYAIAPMSQLAVTATYKTHVEAQSAAAGKKERIAFLNSITPWTGTPHAESTSDKTTTAESLRDTNSAVRSKRIFATFPDIAYIQERRHISSVHPAWLDAVYTRYTPAGISFADSNTYNVYALLASDLKLSGTLYKKGTKITAANWTTLKAAGWADGGMVTVLAPVPGYYYAAELLGLRIGNSPSQSLTNIALGLAKRTYGSQDYFSETQLNTMAEGGTFIMTQANSNSPVVSRHQLSTDVTSIAKRELSITSAIDFAAKFVRQSINPYIGNTNITTNFITLINTILVGIGLYLVRQEIVADFSIVSVTQDSISPDVLNVDIEVLPLYPSNYIRIKMIF